MWNRGESTYTRVTHRPKSTRCAHQMKCWWRASESLLLLPLEENEEVNGLTIAWLFSLRDDWQLCLRLWPLNAQIDWHFTGSKTVSINNDILPFDAHSHESIKSESNETESPSMNVKLWECQRRGSNKSPKSIDKSKWFPMHCLPNPNPNCWYFQTNRLTFRKSAEMWLSSAMPHTVCTPCTRIYDDEKQMCLIIVHTWCWWWCCCCRWFYLPWHMVALNSVRKPKPTAHALNKHAPISHLPGIIYRRKRDEKTWVKNNKTLRQIMLVCISTYH